MKFKPSVLLLVGYFNNVALYHLDSIELGFFYIGLSLLVYFPLHFLEFSLQGFIGYEKYLLVFDRFPSLALAAFCNILLQRLHFFIEDLRSDEKRGL